MNTLVPNVPPDNENWYVLGSGYGPPSIRGILGLLPAPSGFALSSDDARAEIWGDLGSRCGPPIRSVLGLLPAPSGFALSSDDAHDENCYDLGSGCAPPIRGVLGLLAAPLRLCTVF